MDAGASGFVLKDADPDDLVDAIRRLAAGDSVIDNAVTGRVMAEFARRHTDAPQVPQGHQALTAREEEVLRLLASGRSNAEIAAALSVELTTVKSHLGHMLDKTGTRDRLQLAVWAHKHGLA